MVQLATHGSGRAGMQTVVNESIMISTNAITAGDIVAVDEANFTATTGATRIFDRVIQPLVATTTLDVGMYGVAMADAAAEEEVLIRWSGKCQALHNGICTLEDLLAPITAQDYLDAASPGAAVNEKIVAKALETTAGTGLVWVEFDGLGGFGQVNA